MEETRIALIGADGQLGTDLAERIPGAMLQPFLYPEFDLTKAEAAAAVLRKLRPRMIINTAAFNRVDEAEDKYEEAFRVNAFGPRLLAQVGAELDAVLVHFSTDYVFDGRKTTPYDEDDCPRPLNVYGASKLAGEHFVQTLCPKHFLIRTCGLFGKAGCRDKGRNFVETMLALAGQRRPIRVVSDQRLTPTSTAELAENVLALIRTSAFGLYHMTNEGDCSWYEFAAAIFEISGRTADLSPVASLDFPSRAVRPNYSVLENKRAHRLDLPGFSNWKPALAAYLERM
jgi:dTDP-4-dehydrorhamnose reductase